jgi:hypothetical protein
LGRRNRRRYPDQYRIVQYETLATNPERTLREVCDFLDEDYVPEMLSMDGVPRFREQGSNSSYGRRDPGVISTESIGRFREVLSPREIAFVQMLAKNEMASFGYETDRLSLLVPQRIRFATGDLPLQFARVLVWRSREMIRNRTGRAVPDRLIRGPAP